MIPRSFRPTFLRVLPAIVFLASLATSPVFAESIRVGGTGAATDILRRLIEDFRKIQPATEIDVVTPPLGSNGGIRALIAGNVQIAISGLPPAGNDAKGLVVRDFARSPLAFAINNPSAAAITRAELTAIYTGTATRWPDGAPIRLILRPASDSDSGLIRSLSPEVAQALGVALGRPGMVFAAHDLENADLLGKAPGSLGTIPIGQIKAAGLRLRPLPLDGVAPTIDNLANGKYPIAKDFYVSIRESAPPAAKQFAAYLTSDRAREILRRHDFLPVAQ